MRRPVVVTPPATDSTCDLVFLHGFLGTPTEWLALLDRLPAAWRQRCHCLTLPGHGPEAPDAMPWPQLADWLDDELARRQIQSAVLYGYSLGGRLALHYATSAQSLHTDGRSKLAGLVLESANPGLTSPEARRERMHSDALWVQRLRRESLRSVLEGWYRQPVFSDLTPARREELITLRSQHEPRRLAHMLAASSLARQPDLRPWLQSSELPIFYLYGAADLKFATLASELLTACPAMQGAQIQAAGHNLHLTHADEVAAVLVPWLQRQLPAFAIPDSEETTS